MSIWIPCGNSLLIRNQQNVNAYLFIHSSAALPQDLGNFFRARDVVTATRDSDGDIPSCIDSPVSILRSRERDSAMELRTHRDVLTQRREISQQDDRHKRQFQLRTKPKGPPELTAYYKTEHLKFYGHPQDRFLLYRR